MAAELITPVADSTAKTTMHTPTSAAKISKAPISTTGSMTKVTPTALKFVSNLTRKPISHGAAKTTAAASKATKKSIKPFISFFVWRPRVQPQCQGCCPTVSLQDGSRLVIFANTDQLGSLLQPRE